MSFLVQLIAFTYNQLTSPEWISQNVIIRAFTKKGFGLFSCVVGIPFIFLFLVYDILVIFRSKYGKTGIELNENEIVIKYHIVPIKIKWNNIKYIEYDEVEYRTGNRKRTKSTINIYFDKNEIEGQVPNIIVKVLKLNKSPFKIPEILIFRCSIKTVYDQISRYHLSTKNQKSNKE